MGVRGLTMSTTLAPEAVVVSATLTATWVTVFGTMAPVPVKSGGSGVSHGAVNDDENGFACEVDVYGPGATGGNGNAIWAVSDRFVSGGVGTS